MTYVWIWLVTMVTVAGMVTSRPHHPAGDDAKGPNDESGSVHPMERKWTGIGGHVDNVLAEKQGADEPKVNDVNKPDAVYPKFRCHFKICQMTLHGKVVHGDRH